MVEHIGIKIELIGQIGMWFSVVVVAWVVRSLVPRSRITELFYDRGNPHEFTCLVRELEPPGQLNESKSYPFEFANVEKQYETYCGNNVRLRCVSAFLLLAYHTMEGWFSSSTRRIRISA
jgi:hypothetical protein